MIVAIFRSSGGAARVRYLSSMSPAAGHSSLAHGNADLDDGFDDLDLRHSTRGRARRINGRIAARYGDRFRENGTGVTSPRDAPSRMHVVLARANLGVITKRRPRRPAARPSCYSYHSSLFSLVLPRFPSASLFGAFTLSPSVSLEVPTDTDGYQMHPCQLIDIS